MTNDDILNLADKHLDYSDHGVFFGSEDDILEFANDLIIAYFTEKEKQQCQHG